MYCKTITGSALLLDCDTLTRVLTRTVLEQTGFSVREATGFEEAVAQSSIMSPDIIVVNPMKAPETALSFCAHIRQQTGGWRVPILAMIWANAEKAIRSAYDAGATDIVTMPCHHLVLHFRLRCAIRAHRLLGTPNIALAGNTPPPLPVEHTATSRSVAHLIPRRPREVPAAADTCATFPGMPNKHAFENLLHVAISSSKKLSLTVFFMEIENAAEGIDTALQRGLELFIGRMTSRYFPVGRLGPLQFSLLLIDVVAWSEVRRNALSIIDDLTVAFGREENRTSVAIKIGVSVYPDDGHDAAVLLKKAEIARYLVSEAGGTSGFHFYRPLCTDSSVYYDSLMIT